MRQLLIATRNKGKIKEIKYILKDIPFAIKTLDDIDFADEVEETGKSFKENAILKAKTVGDKIHLLTLAEDSGLEIDILGGKPGIYSARFVKGSDVDRIHALLKELTGIPKEKRTAQFKAVIALYNPMSKKPYTFEGISEGYITEKTRGENGFGYDPIFFNLDLGKTNGEATEEEKNKVSHRARALARCKAVLEDL